MSIASVCGLRLASLERSLGFLVIVHVCVVRGIAPLDGALGTRYNYICNEIE